MKTAGSWGGAEGALGAEREGREGLAQRGAGLRVTPAGTVAADPVVDRALNDQQSRK